MIRQLFELTQTVAKTAVIQLMQLSGRLDNAFKLHKLGVEHPPWLCHDLDGATIGSPQASYVVLDAFDLPHKQNLLMQVPLHELKVDARCGLRHIHSALK